jgi:hypothetical protein
LTWDWRSQEWLRQCSVVSDSDQFDFTQSQVHVNLKHPKLVVLSELVDYLKTRFTDPFRQAMHPRASPVPVTRFEM